MNSIPLNNEVKDGAHTESPELNENKETVENNRNDEIMQNTQLNNQQDSDTLSEIENGIHQESHTPDLKREGSLKIQERSNERVQDTQNSDLLSEIGNRAYQDSHTTDSKRKEAVKIHEGCTEIVQDIASSNKQDLEPSNGLEKNICELGDCATTKSTKMKQGEKISQ